MKNLLRNLTLVVISVFTFSCDDPKADTHDLAPTSIAKLLAADATGQSPKYSSFNEALIITGMDSMLDQAGTYTVLAPNDYAFADVLGGLSVEAYDLANPGVLEAIVKNHIINSKIASKDLTDGQVIPTSLGQNITVDLQDNAYYPEYDSDLGTFEQTSIFLNDARVFARDVPASNGTINEINKVLVPSS